MNKLKQTTNKQETGENLCSGHSLHLPRACALLTEGKVTSITLHLSDIDSFRATPLPSIRVAYQFLSSEGRENINTSITLKGIKNYLKEAKTGNEFKENEVTKLQKAEMPLSSLTSGGSPEYKGRRYEPPMTYPSLKT